MSEVAKFPELINQINESNEPKFIPSALIPNGIKEDLA